MADNKKKQRSAPVQKQQEVPEKDNTQGAAPFEEQMMRRQSAPRPTAEDGVRQMQQNPGYQGVDFHTTAVDEYDVQMPAGVTNGLQALSAIIGREQILQAQMTMQKYKEGKANLEQRIIDNEQWFKMRHWECMRKESKSPKEQVEPSSGWLFNAIANKHADAMDNFPCPNILPREEGDKQEAKMLSSIVPVILEQNDFEEVYDNVWDYKLKAGTGIYKVSWDQSKLNGLGDISVQKVDIINLFWESGITDIQKSPNFFHVELVNNDELMMQYPQLEGKLSTPTMDVSKYLYDDTVDTNNKSLVVDWYYKKRQDSRTVLHYCKYVNDVVLFATENESKKYPNGWYEHGLYPFVFDPLFSVEGTPCGFSYIDVGKSAQEYIDRGNQAIMQNMLANAKPRHFVRIDGSVNEDEYLDLSKSLVHVDGNLGQDSIMPINGKPLSSIYVQCINNKIDELKEVTGNRDISTGGTSSGVTAASAIAAMQEAGSKLSRDNNKASYRAFRKVVLMIIELIRQFYDLPRCFRIMGENGAAEFVEYSNAGIRPQPQVTGDGEFGVEIGPRLPLFDVEITAQKQSPYSKMAQNELAIQFYNAGFFNPQMSDQALACLEMMDFDRKQFVVQRISQNGTMYQQLLMMQQQMFQLAQIVDLSQGTNLAEQMAAGMSGAPAAVPQGKAEVKDKSKGESSTTKNARQRVADSTSPT